MDLTMDVFVRLAYALGIGLLIGLERTHDHQRFPSAEAAPATKAFMGLRTFSILALAGFTTGLLGPLLPGVATALSVAAAALVVAMYLREKDAGITTEAAAVAAIGLGALCNTRPHTAGVLALAITVLLASKRLTHDLGRRLRRVELTDTLKLLVVVLIVLPLLPNRALDPWGVFNPFKVCLLVVLISGIGFVGYFLTRMLGAERGLAITGLLGGLTSSTAVTAAMAARARADAGLTAPSAFAAVVANLTMFARVLVVVALLDPALARELAVPLATMLAAAAVALLFLRRRAQAIADSGVPPPDGIELDNPFSLGPALKFAVFFVAILVVAKLAQQYLGTRGLYLAALASGLADVDAITLTIAGQRAAGQIPVAVGATAVVLAVVSNSAVKTGIAFYAGGGPFGRAVGCCLAVATGAGLLVAVLV